MKTYNSIQNKILLLLLTTMTFSVAYAADTPHKQLLVFRNSGEVNLFFTDSIQSITIENNDSLGLCQVFQSHGAVKRAIPIAEIDSVAFGSRNRSEFKFNVRVLKDDVDIPFIQSYDGESIVYRSSAPTSVIPAVGELLFYGQITDLFPIGVCSRVTSVSKNADNTKVNIETVDPSEIFSQYFYAGDASDPELQKMAQIMSRVSKARENVGSISLNTDNVKAEIALDVEFTEMVFNARQHFYHAKCTLTPKAEIGLNLDLKEVEWKKKYLEKTKTLTPIALVFIPSFDFAAFLKVEAEVCINLELTREFAVIYEWTRQNGVNTFSDPVITGINGGNDGFDQVKTYIQIDGEVFTGLEVAARFGLIGDFAGAGMKVNAGPRLTGELGLGLLSNLSNFYSPETYAKGQLSVAMGVDFQTFLYHKSIRDIFKPGFETVSVGPELSLDFMKQELDLFPKFENTMCITTGQQSVVSRTEVSDPVVYPLDIGFNLEEATEEEEDFREPISTAFLDEVLEANNDEPVGFTYSFEEIPTSGSTIERKCIRPVFKYGDYVIKAAPANASKNCFYNYFTQATQSGAGLIGGAVDVRTKTSGESCVLIGNFFPRMKKNPLFSYGGGEGINLETAVFGPMLYGTWQGHIADQDVVLIFNTDGTGSYNDSSFKFELNTPQAGDIKMKFDDAAMSNATYTIIELIDSTLSLKKKGKSNINIFNRQ